MEITRRELAVLAAGACAGCGILEQREPRVKQPVDCGPAEAFASDGIYDKFRHQGFFLVRHGATLAAISSDCTHRDCPLRVTDGAFSCRCHGSKFSDTGALLRGPAQRPLPHFATSKDEQGHLVVHVLTVKFDEE